ncbi:MAG TPA: SOS response-associated peptidase [Trueperaceae bacterium]|jgi:putative SOS response-associated peptidase YedK|nr:SOS response-associated peptidase [Trueperaceae bacterium]
MCGRYTLYHHEDDLASLFEVEAFPLTERYNIAPTQLVPVVRGRDDGTREMISMRWGLVPHWVKDPAEFKANLFNARSESAAEKPSFRDAMRSGRCLLPASGFYEWKQEAGAKQPYFIHRKDGAPMALAGLYSHWGRGEGAMLTCTILTTDANDDVRQLHDRMPVILERGDWERWLDPGERDAHAVEDLLGPADDGLLESWPVSKAVGNARVDGPELVARV